MGALLGLVTGLGLLLVFRALTDSGERRRRQPLIGPRVEQLLRSAGIVTVTPWAFAWLCVISGLLAGVVVLLVSRTPPVALAFGVMAAYGPVALVRGRARGRRRQLAEVWPEAVDNLASAVRAGLSLPEALSQLGERGPTPLRPAFASFGRDYLVSGRSATVWTG